jgi:acyl-CoA reductase-like NAD-dependent aldehyde dehydrogenase
MKFFASTWMRGAFQSAGQNCIGVELFLVPRARQQEFIDLLLPRVQALRVGTDVGALISHAPIKRLEKLIQAAQAGGARLLAGGAQYSHPDKPEGAYFAPTLIADVSLDMEIAREELFAPVMTVVPYDNVDEALAKLRTARFGLGGSVYGKSRKECMHVAKELQCGMVSLNE